jgi:hypothetical protein
MSKNIVEVNLENYLLMQNNFLERTFRKIQEKRYLEEFQSGEVIIIQGSLGFSHIIISSGGTFCQESDDDQSIKILGLGENREGFGFYGFDIEGTKTRIQKRDNVQMGNEFFSFFSSLTASYREQVNTSKNILIQQTSLDTESLSFINMEKKARPFYQGEKNLELDITYNFEVGKNYQLNVEVPIYNIVKTMLPDPSQYVFTQSNLGDLIHRLNGKARRNGSNKVFTRNSLNTNSIQELNESLMDIYSSILNNDTNSL